jgi:hypothetical protein
VKHTVPDGWVPRVVLVAEKDDYRTDPPGQGSALPHGDIAPTKTFRSSRNRAGAPAPDPTRPAGVHAESRGPGITWAKPNSPEARRRAIWHPPASSAEASRRRSSTNTRKNTSAPLANLITLGARDYVSLCDFYRNLGWPIAGVLCAVHQSPCAVAGMRHSDEMRRGGGEVGERRRRDLWLTGRGRDACAACTPHIRAMNVRHAARIIGRRRGRWRATRRGCRRGCGPPMRQGRLPRSRR